MSRVTRKLIVNADDFGISPSVNKAVIDCFIAGNVTSATMMVNMQGSVDAARLAKDNPKLGVGLHFCLTEGRPLSRCPSLTGPGGAFLDRRTLLARALLGGVSREEIRAELEAQLDRAADLGLSLTHVDSHQHVHMCPPIFPCVAETAARRGLALRVVRPPISAGLLLSRPLKFTKQLVLTVNGALYRSAAGVRSNDRLISIHDLPHGEPVGPAAYDRLLTSAAGSETVELMVHPYILGDDLLALYGASLASRLPNRCGEEYRTLSGPPLFSSKDLELTTYASL
ncbi:MAG: ChbG/HpnK family deacetylase [Elusimicrobia bacterium]|nr:ChbG/HpnK family deacetylase [Elusimicrobiota bacterium]